MTTEVQQRPAIQDRPTGKPWSFAEAAEYIGVGQRSLRRYAAQGRLRTISE